MKVKKYFPFLVLLLVSNLFSTPSLASIQFRQQLGTVNPDHTYKGVISKVGVNFDNRSIELKLKLENGKEAVISFDGEDFENGKIFVLSAGHELSFFASPTGMIKDFEILGKKDVYNTYNTYNTYKTYKSYHGGGGSGLANPNGFL